MPSTPLYRQLEPDADQRDQHDYYCRFYRIGRGDERANLDKLLESDKTIVIQNTIRQQLREFMQCSNPGQRMDAAALDKLAAHHLEGRPEAEYGVWVHYPWLRSLVHLLDEKEFAMLRTNRNKNKITGEEQALLGTRKIGVIGLSVGQSVALTLAMERSFGELRLADFDTLDGSNLNRIRASVQDLGLNKAVVAARQIAALDPFLRVRCYTEGITAENIDAFFGSGDEKLDLLIEECDSMEIKLLARYKAKALGVPVLMDTSDRGLIDVERFDLEPERPILHGLVAGLKPEDVAAMPPQQRMQTALQIAGGDNISARGKASLPEIGRTILTWPQLASAVVMGGGATADVARRLLLQHLRSSGRYYVDVGSIIPDDTEPLPE